MLSLSHQATLTVGLLDHELWPAGPLCPVKLTNLYTSQDSAEMKKGRVSKSQRLTLFYCTGELEEPNLAKKRCRMMGSLGEPRGSLMMKEAEKRLWVERANTQLGVVKLESENSSGGSVPRRSM